MVAKKPDSADLLEAKLRVITAAVEGLRRRGVSRLTIDGFSIEIDAPPPEVKTVPRGAPDPELEDLLDVTKFRRPRRQDDDA